jgi:hypothetical protein
MRTPPVTVTVDFNNLSNGLVKASKRLVRGVLWYDLVPGRAVWAVDADDNACYAYVEEVADRTMRIRPIWESWQAGRGVLELHPEFQPTWPRLPTLPSSNLAQSPQAANPLGSLQTA